MMPRFRRQRNLRSERVPQQTCLDVTEFRGEWVALHPKTYKVIGHGASLEEARKSTPNVARLEPILYFVPESDAFYVGRGEGISRVAAACCSLGRSPRFAARSAPFSPVRGDRSE
jgi:hypothetical protein